MHQKSKNLLAIIPARGGSKGLPRKNILEVAGKPLIAWTISAANESKAVDCLVLSTEDSAIIETAKAWGCQNTHHRPDNLACDETTSMEVVLHVLERYSDFEYVVLLQPTSPLRNGLDIDNAFSLLKSSNATSCVSICEVEESPFWMYFLDEKNAIAKVIPEPGEYQRRQDLPKVYTLNGAIYIAKTEWLLETKTFISSSTVGYLMPQECSVDIDDVQDLELAIKQLAKKNL